MAPMFKSLRSSLDKRARYRRTLNELRNLPIETRLDLEIAGIEAEVARQAVYG